MSEIHDFRLGFPWVPPVGSLRTVRTFRWVFWKSLCDVLYHLVPVSLAPCYFFAPHACLTEMSAIWSGGQYISSKAAWHQVVYQIVARDPCIRAKQRCLILAKLTTPWMKGRGRRESASASNIVWGSTRTQAPESAVFSVRLWFSNTFSTSMP